MHSCKLFKELKLEILCRSTIIYLCWAGKATLKSYYNILKQREFFTFDIWETMLPHWQTIVLFFLNSV